MKKIDLIKVCSDFGVHVAGTNLGPDAIANQITSNQIDTIYRIARYNIKKDFETTQKKKNMRVVNEVNKEVFQTVTKSLMDGKIPFTIGGDHSIAIGSALASQNYYHSLGLIWFDAHADYNTFDTTITGNIHGVPFATITGQNGRELTSFFNGEFFHPDDCVLVGARSIDFPGEWDNLQKAGIHIFTTEDIQQMGIEKVCEEAIKIVSRNTNQYHISLDVDVMDPQEAPGVSVPEENGISAEQFIKGVNCFWKKQDKIKSFDLVEYNPSFDIKNKTLDIIMQALRIIFS